MDRNQQSYTNTIRVPTEVAEESANKITCRWTVLVGVFLVNFITPTAQYSYGVMLLSFYDAGDTISKVLQAPLFHAAAFLICVPWARSAAPRWGAHVRMVPLVGVILLCAGLGFSALLSLGRTAAYIACYGILGGAGVSVVQAHVRFTINRWFSGNPGLVQGLCSAGQAAGRFAMPHLTLSAVHYYGQRWTHAILAAVMMNMAAAILLLTMNGPKNQHPELTSVSDPDAPIYPRVSAMGLMSEEGFADRSWKCPSDGNTTQTLSPPLLRRTSCGVDILQSIPEESESSDDESSDGELEKGPSIKPLQNCAIAGAGDYIYSIKPHATMIDLTEMDQPKIVLTTRKIFPTVRFPRSVRIRNSLSIFRKVEIYPCILLSTCELLMPLLHSTLTPLHARSVLKDLTNSEAVFLMALASFAWLCLVLGAPWLAACKPMRMRIFFVIGIFLKFIGLVGIVFSRTHDLMTLASVVFGIGHGGTSATAQALIKNCIGDHHYNKFEGTMDTISGLVVIAFAVSANVFIEDKTLIKRCFITLSIIEIVSMLFVVILPCIVSFCTKECIKCFKNPN